MGIHDEGDAARRATHRRPMERQAAWFRRLLRLFPADFQADYAADMERTFRDQRRDAGRNGVRAVGRLWLETIIDLVRTAPSQHAEQLAQDVRYAARTMAGRPGFTAAIALVLGIGIAATTSIFSIVDAAVLRPLPYADAGRLVAVRERTRDAAAWELSYPAYLELRQNARSFDVLAAYMRNGIVIGGGEKTTRMAALVSWNFLEVLRVQPIAGRPFTTVEDSPGAPPVALIREDLARARFGSPREAIGRSITIDQRAVVVVGVVSSRLRFPDAEVDVWLPIGALADEPWMRNRAVHLANVFGRTRPDTSLADVRAELELLMARMQTREPSADPDHRLIVDPLADVVSAAARPATRALAGAVLLLLVVTCSSVGLLLLTRAAGRAGELAVRQSLGASRARLARQLLTEILCVAIVGCAIAMAGAPVLLGFLYRGLESSLPPFVVPRVNGAAVSIAVLSAAAAAVIAGLVPATRMLDGVRRGATRRRRPTLLVAQVAVSCVLVVIASLLVRSLDRLLRVEIGFRPDRLLVMRVIRPLAPDPAPGAMTRFYEAAAARVRRLPGISDVAVVSTPPLEPGSRGDLTIEGQPGRATSVVTYKRVLPGYFAALGIPLLEGRDFDARDDGRDPVIILNAAAARSFWPAGRAVGQRVNAGPPEQRTWKRVIGVVGDVRNLRLDEAPDLAAYEPHAQRPWNGMFMMIRAAGDAAALAGPVRRALREVEPEILVSAVSTMEDRMAASVAPRRFQTIVVGAFASATLLLLGLALYATLAYFVSAQERELGIRAALGASSSALRRHVLAHGLRPTIAGVLIGLPAGALAAFAARTLLFEVAPSDAPTYAATAALVLTVAIAACWVPARRTTRLDPAVALRAE